VQLAGLDQRGEHRPVCRPFVAAGKQSILSVQSDAAQGALDGIGVDLDAAVVKKADQPIPMVEVISEAWAIDEALATCTRVFSSQVFSDSGSTSPNRPRRRLLPRR
jgi:hypothetical protein